MKKNSYEWGSLAIILVTLLALSFVSCSKEGGDGIASGTSSLNFSADGGTQSLTIVAGSSWSVTDAPSWVTVSPSSGSNGKIQIVVTASRNYETSRRTGTVTLGGADYRMSFSVTQDAAEVSDEISASVSSMSFTANGESMNMSVTSNFSWSTIDKPSWITISPSSGSSGTTSLTITASKSSSTTSRTGTITFGKASSATVSISVSQAAASSGGSDKSFTVTGNGKSVTFKMKYVEHGTFMMGAVENIFPEDCYPAHKVTLTKNYYIGEAEVTQALWYAVTGDSPTAENFLSSCGHGDNYPVYNISYEDCKSFISKLNTMTSQKFRLPTEAEWEFAAIGGNKSLGYNWAGSNNINEVAWYDDNSNGSTHIVKTKAPNELGIYDMSGNVGEWCNDWFGSYSSYAQTDPQGPTTGTERVHRGGGHHTWDWPNRILYRGGFSPKLKGWAFGLRLAL